MVFKAYLQVLSWCALAKLEGVAPSLFREAKFLRWGAKFEKLELHTWPLLQGLLRFLGVAAPIDHSPGDVINIL